MLTNRVISIWLLIQLIPLGILYFVYTFFSEQNFFNIEGAWKGIVASGPIAAYIFITWMGFRYFKELLSIGFKLNEEIETVVGNWIFDSSSEQHSKNAKGSCEISVQDNKVKISGNYAELNEMETIWQSDIAFLDGNNLFYVYNLDSHGVRYIGYVRLRVSKKIKTKSVEMKGEWVAIGNERKRGNITLTRELTR
jgi:hypothetical protein